MRERTVLRRPETCRRGSNPGQCRRHAAWSKMQREPEATMHICRDTFILAGVSVGLLAATAPAADPEQYDRNWPQWRGPAGNGLVLNGNPPLRWAEGMNVKWKVALPGLGHSTPIIWGHRV